ncbi:MAG: zinc ribbon domain-containing protein [Verrucomicrobiota bacterium]
MPFQRFRPTSGRCKLCKGNLELSLGPEEATPTECPKCGQVIETAPTLSAPRAKINKKPSVSEAKSAGFKVLKRISEGEYESQ